MLSPIVARGSVWDTATNTIRNVNGVVLDVRKGKGTAGLLVEDPATAADVKQSIANVRQTTEKLNTGRLRLMPNPVQS